MGRCRLGVGRLRLLYGSRGGRLWLGLIGLEWEVGGCESIRRGFLSGVKCEAKRVALSCASGGGGNRQLGG